MLLPLPFSYFQKVGIHHSGGAHVISDYCHTSLVALVTFLSLPLPSLPTHTQGIIFSFSF